MEVLIIIAVAIVVLAILWVRIINTLRRKVNQLIDEIGVIV